MFEQREKRSHPQETEQPETVNLYTIRKAELLMPGKTIAVELQGTTINKIAEEVDSQVYAIRTFKRKEGIAHEGGKGIKVQSDKIYDKGTTYIDGELMTVWQAKKIIPDIAKNKRLFPTQEGRDFDRIIRIRTGILERFTINDRNITLPRQLSKH